MTRRTNTFIALEERTAIANRAGADLFLSIHSNASASDSARGVETYFLNFAPNPQAEAIAARENAGGSRTMRNLPDIVRAIALNNKIDESRDFASMVQNALYTKLQKTNKNVRNLGVKQAPFMVLVGATMPSILAEISFITNRQEATLLKTDKYKQQIAEALLAGVLRYQQALKKVRPSPPAGRSAGYSVEAGLQTPPSRPREHATFYRLVDSRRSDDQVSRSRSVRHREAAVGPLILREIEPERPGLECAA